MQNQLHLVLGASGATGMAVLEELKNRNIPHIAVNRSSEVAGVKTLKADLKDAESLKKVVAGATHVYLCAGLPYTTEVWQRDWEFVMANTIEACAGAGAKLIFLDNIYMYGPSPLPVPFDESTTQNPPSRKGIARKRTADLLLEAVQAGRIKALIGRSADFYGERAVNSTFYISFLERMLKGKNPQVFIPGNVKHTFANVEDNARALVALAMEEDCYGQVWHLPVGEPVTIEHVLEIFNKTLDGNFKLQFLPPLMRKMLSLFIRPLKEVEEMLYQFENDYVMSFEKFHKRFPGFEVTSYETGIQKMVKWFQEHSPKNSNL